MKSSYDASFHLSQYLVRGDVQPLGEKRQLMGVIFFFFKLTSHVLLIRMRWRLFLAFHCMDGLLLWTHLELDFSLTKWFFACVTFV